MDIKKAWQDGQVAAKQREEQETIMAKKREESLKQHEIKRQQNATKFLNENLEVWIKDAVARKSSSYSDPEIEFNVGVDFDGHNGFISDDLEQALKFVKEVRAVKTTQGRSIGIKTQVIFTITIGK